MIQILNYQYQPVCHLKSDGYFIEGEAYDIYFTQDINNLDTLEFSIPLYVMNKKTGQNDYNWRVEYIIPEQLIKFTYQNYQDFFYVKEII